MNLSRWTSQPSVMVDGTTKVSADLWNKNTLVKQLERDSKDFINKIATKFKNTLAFSKLLTDAINQYTVDFGFNEIMMLMKYLNNFEDPKYNIVLAQAIKIWRSKPPLLLANCRIMAHLTANCVCKTDMVVYRGMKDRRTNRLSSLAQAKTDLKSIDKIDQLEKRLGEMLTDRHLISDVISRGYLLEDDLINSHDFEEVSNIISMVTDEKLQIMFNNQDASNLINGIGNEVITETFMSTSLSIEQARRFIDKESKCCLLQIFIPKGTPCLYVTPFSDYTDESTELEVVIPPCANLVVMGKNQGITRIRYNGISDTAKKRMTLDLPRLYVLEQMVDSLNTAKIASRKAAFATKNINGFGDLSSIGNIGLIDLCNSLDGTHDRPLNEGKFLTTFSNDQLQDEFLEKDYEKYKFDPYKKYLK